MLPAMSQRSLVALVSGGNRGLGFEVCRQLADKGFTVMLGARDLEKGRAAAARLPKSVVAVELDVAHPDHAAQLAQRVQKDHGRIDVLVNNAGIHYDSDETATTADWKIVREAFEVNLFGAWRLAQAIAPMMRAARYGRIVNVSSQAGSLSTMSGGTPAYSTSKAALNALTRVLAGELAGTGVLVNSVCPGWVATDMGGKGGRPVAEGAAGIVWAATLPDNGPTGGFFRDGTPLPW
ncbi:MAG TPA: SDR family oxidoreductase [Vicinamibacterales bacterium]|nr:SDR family oxidoreductase [Vicinamibacterales bacterium]